tara:strand:- start:343 stop:621 length:279 start_codon:yes stop_codon:yes gene_type:complete
MEKSQALGIVVGAGILGSLATYLLWNSNNGKVEDLEEPLNSIDSMKKIEKKTNETNKFLSNFWRDTYKKENKQQEQKQEKKTDRESYPEDYN